MDSLPETLPDTPLPLFQTWFDEAVARRDTDNPNAMVVATVDAQSQQPSARVVLCRSIAPAQGLVRFFTNYLSQKGQQLASAPHAAAVFHWDRQARQVRIEGPVLRAPEPASDGYFARRPPGSRIGAWASEQSRPLASREQLLAQVSEQAERFGAQHDGGIVDDTASAAIDVPRPPHWGGYDLWIARIELWCGGAQRIHDRAVWQRDLALNADGSIRARGGWQATRLQP